MDIKGKKIHFIGVGGISMSALAELSISLGATVSGSDRAFSPALSKLAALGAKVYVGSDLEPPKNADYVIYSSAIPKNDVERVIAENPIERSIFLGEISKLFEKVIAISGTHGKTTTTCMLASIYNTADKKFTAHVGGISRNFCSNLVQQGKDSFITEACEYRKSFLTLNPDITIILNIEYDHPDCYSDLAMLGNTFSELVSNTKQGGLAVLGENVESFIHSKDSNHIKQLIYGKDFISLNINESEDRFTLQFKEYMLDVTLSQKGVHNIKNASIAAVAALSDGISPEAVIKGLAEFKGVARRYETVGNPGGCRIISDYAHHPSEIRAVINTAKRESDYVIAVFEPHTYSRTASLLNEFANAFSGADTVIILPTYSARENPANGVDSEKLFFELVHKEKYFVKDYTQCATLIKNLARAGNIVLLLGAGSIDCMRDMLIPKSGKQKTFPH